MDGPRRNVHYPEGYVTPDKQYIHFVFDDNRHQAVWVRAKLPPIPEKPVSAPNPPNPWLEKPAPPPSAAKQGPVNIIFDCDMGNDMDDAMALAVLHALESRGESKLLAVTTTKGNALSAPVLDLINTFYGRPGIPIGIASDGPTPFEGGHNDRDKNYARGLLELKKTDGAPAFKTTHPLDYKHPDAVTLLRKTLAAQPDQSVVIVQTGFFTNLNRLLRTQPDKVSPLSGKELVGKKVRFVSLMAGNFTNATHKEFNVRLDIPAAAAMARDWPTEMIFCGYEIGAAILYPPRSLKKDFDYMPFHPIKEGCRRYNGLEKPQPTFDVNSALYAVRPGKNYYGLSEPGEVSFTESGETRFKPDPNGRHRYMKFSGDFKLSPRMKTTPQQIDAVQNLIVELTSRKPD